MFDSPFDSFQKVVADAKGERDQLDRLLTISTPRERLLVVLTGTVIALFATWFFIGSATRTLAIDGLLVEPAEHTTANTLSAVVWLDSERSQEITIGTPVTITVAPAHRFDGEVSAIAAIPLQAALVDAESQAPVTMRRLEVSMPNDTGFKPSREGAACRIVFTLDAQSPAAFFGLRGA